MKESEPGSDRDPISTLCDPTDLSSQVGGEKKTLVLFEISGCPYCRAFEPRFLEFASAAPKDLRLLRVKLDDPRNPLWEKYDLLAVPSALVFSSGQVVARVDSGLGLGLSKKKWLEFCAGI